LRSAVLQKSMRLTNGGGEACPRLRHTGGGGSAGRADLCLKEEGKKGNGGQKPVCSKVWWNNKLCTRIGNEKKKFDARRSEKGKAGETKAI